MGTICLLIITLGGLVPLYPMLLEGAWNSHLYLYKNQLDTLQPFVNFYEGLLLQGRNLNHTNLSVSSNLNFTNRFQGTGRNGLELSHLYLDWQDDSSRVSLRAGRQGFYDGVVPLFLDGLRARWRPHRIFALTGAGGMRVPSRFSKALVQTRIDSSALNLVLRADCRPGKKTVMDLLYHQGFAQEAVLKQEAGLNIRQRFTANLQALAGLHYDLLRREPEEMLLSVRFQPFPRAGFHGSFSRQNPQIDTVSFPDTLTWGKCVAGSLNGSFDLGRKTALSLGYTRRLFSGGKTENQVTGRVNYAGIFLGYRQDQGDQGWGSRTGAGFQARLNPTWAGGVYGSYMAYQFSSLDSTRRQAWQGALYADISPWKILELRLEYQVLGNRYFDYDHRFFMKTRVQFSQFRK
jgi:hypothetical protein